MPAQASAGRSPGRRPTASTPASARSTSATTRSATTTCDLLDPYRNLAIAAEILQEQHTPGEDWLVAIGRYHRPAGGAPAARYRRSVHQHLTRVLGPGASISSARSPMP